MRAKRRKKSKKKFFSIISIIILILIVLVSVILFNKIKNKNNIKKENLYGTKYSELVEDGLKRFPKEARNFNLFLQDYSAFGDYLNYGKNKDILFNFPALKMNEDGFPTVKYGEKYYYNPVTLAQYALAVYGEYLEKKSTKEEFLKIVDKLLTLQDERGAFLYNFPWRYYLNEKDYEPGWVSGMAQGQALSVLARAYHITKEDKYLESGKKSLEFMLTDVKDGGVKANLGNINEQLKDNVIFEEYITDIPSYTLNGFMFSILGLYDWNKIESVDKSKVKAKIYFKKSIDSLEKILQYYDVGGFSCYDLGYLTRTDRKPHIAPNYHGVHIYLLNALYSITGNNDLLYYKDLWQGYVKDIVQE